MPEGGYIIRGGVEGRERLRLLSRVLRPTTLALFDRVGVRSGMACLDVGCGGGDVAFDLARIVGPQGRVVGTDLDGAKLDLARWEAGELGLGNVEFNRSDVVADGHDASFDLVYARFVLTHLKDPAAALARMYGALGPGGTLVVEDIDFRGHFCYPDCPAFDRYVGLYTAAALGTGADPHIGPRLPSLLAGAGCRPVGMSVVQPAGVEGEVKLVAPVTLENVADAVVAAGLITRAELGRVLGELYEFARNPTTVMSLPRVVQAWGLRQATGRGAG
jgi:SAM-dependent methyltransferase